MIGKITETIARVFHEDEYGKPGELSALSTPADIEPVAHIVTDPKGKRRVTLTTQHDPMASSFWIEGAMPEGYSVTPLYAAPVADSERVSVPEGWVLVQQAALDWLFGEGPDPAGFHFGDWPEDIPRPQGAFWWRSVFRQILAAAPQPNPSKVDASAVIEAARKIRHWHDAMADNSGMVVSAESVHNLWSALDAYDAALAAQGEKP